MTRAWKHTARVSRNCQLSGDHLKCSSTAQVSKKKSKAADRKLAEVDFFLVCIPYAPARLDGWYTETLLCLALVNQPSKIVLVLHFLVIHYAAVPQ